MREAGEAEEEEWEMLQSKRGVDGRQSVPCRWCDADDVVCGWKTGEARP